MKINALVVRNALMFCPSDVFEMQDEKSVPVNEKECIGCESGVEVCESEAIRVTEVED